MWLRWGSIERCAGRTDPLSLSSKRARGDGKRRRAMTLLELMLAMSILLMVVGILGGLAQTAQQGFEYSEGYGVAAQHARVVLDRIARDVGQATANAAFPGCMVSAETVGSYRYPDTLVVWKASGTVTAGRLPCYNELVIYCPNPSAPNQFVQMTTTNTSTAPAADDASAWLTALTALKKDAATKTVVLTDLLRTCSTGSGTATRGAVRFEARLRPSAADWTSYAAGSTTWSNLPWAQGVYGTKTGLRQVWVRTELQLTPGVAWTVNDSAAVQVVPYFGSAALYYTLYHL
jgi:type II secretory pathway pseudopilin PulG